MKIYKLFLIGFLVLISCREESSVPNYVDFVDPQIGSVHGRWFFYTPASVPYGMAKLAPHTNAYGSPGSWGPCGYDDRHGSIEGFGHFHEFQIGGVVFMPTVGKLKTVPGTLEEPDTGYRSRFSKNNEQSEPGYYRVLLEDYGVEAEITATPRVGFHRYTFPETDQANLIIDVGHKQGESSDVTKAVAKWVSDTEVVGYVETNPEYVKFCDPGERVKMYFVAQLSKKPEHVGRFTDQHQEPGETTSEGVSNGLYLTFSMNKNEKLEIKTGLSYTSIDNARLNLFEEANDLGFDEVRAQATEIWNEHLGKIEVEGGLTSDRKKFYTGLYHALLGRGLANDVNGQYPKSQGVIGQIPLDDNGIPTYNHYNTDGIWGGFWNLSQVWALAYPSYFSSYIQSNIDFYKDRGWLHDGRANYVFTNGVQTNFQGLLLASAYNVGIRDFDVKTGYEAALKNEIEFEGRNLGNGKYDLSYFVKNKYIPYMETVVSNGWVFNFGGSHTLEYSFSSYAVAQMSKQLRQTSDYLQLMEQADYYRNLFDEDTKYIRPKNEDGSFIKNFDPMKGWDGFQEGNAFQYTWYVPHDPSGLIGLIGKELFNERLENMFIAAQKNVFGGGSEEIHSFSGVEKNYNHGNQPCLHNAWLFNYSQKPWLTQKWTRTICNEFYGTEALHGYGYGQDEDQGQLGAWYVMASMGIFDVQGHSAARPSFQFGSPLFDKITIHLDEKYYSGKQLVIKTQNQHPENFYIQEMSWNNSKIENSWMYRDELMQGGELIFTLGPKPNTKFGIKTLPPSMSTEKNNLK